MNTEERPDALLVTVSKQTVKEWGGLKVMDRFWQMHFGTENEALFYWRCGNNLPTKQVAWIFMVVDNKVRWKFHCVEYADHPDGIMLYKYGDPDKGQMMKGKFVVITGPVQTAPKEIPYRGFQGFRYEQSPF